MGLEHMWTRVDGVFMHALVSPAGTAGCPALVLVHGVIASSDYLAPTAELLADDFRVYVPDLPGYGRSATRIRAADVPFLADSLVAWMDAVGLYRASLAGNSFGCQILAELAVRYPDRVERLILIGPTVDVGTRSLMVQALRLALDGPRERLSLWPILLHSLRQMGLRRAMAAVRSMMQDHIEDKLPAIEVPVLVLRGERDPVAPQRWVEEVAHLLPHARLEILPGTAHAANYSAPQDVATAIRRFLRPEP